MHRHVRRPFQFPHAFYKETHNPIWLLLQNPPKDRLHLEAALISSKIPPAEYTQWRSTLLHPSLTHIPEMPSWVVLYQLLHKVRSSHDASGPVLDVLHAYLPLAPRELHAPLLVLTAYHLSTYGLQVPLQPLVARFLETPIPLEHQEHAFNFLLRALSASPVRSVPSANNVVLLLAAMNDRQIPLRPSTYRALLNDRFVTLQLTKHLHAKMLKEGVVPTAEHLEAFLRVFAKNGAIHEARRYFAAIHALTKGKEREEEGRDVRLSANTLMLGVHDDKASAFAFLRRLAEFSTPPHSSTSTTSKIPLTTNPKPLTTSKPPPRFIHPSSPSIYDQTTALHLACIDLSTPTRQIIHLFLTLSAPPTVATYTVLIRGLLKRKEWAKAELFWRRLARLCVGGGRAGGRANADELLTASDEVGTENEKGRVNMQGPTYIRHRRMVMDNAALCAGLQALIRGGKPHRAIKVLEKYAWKPGVSPVRQDTEIANLGRDRDSTSSSTSPPTASSFSSPFLPSSTQKLTPPPIRLTPITLSELLVSFKRASRPDIVLFLFAHMTTLYGVQPNESCLSVMMQSARMGEGMDDCVQGVMERMKVRVGWGSSASVTPAATSSTSTSTFTSAFTTTVEASSSSSPATGTPTQEQRRAALISRLYALTGHPTQKHPTPYKSCTQLVYPYRGAGPAEYARGVFLETVWGGAWSGGYALMAAGGGDGNGIYAGSGNASGKGGKGNGKGKDKEEGQRVAREGLRGIDLSEVKAPARAVREDEDGETSLRSLWGGKDREWVPPRGVCLLPPVVTSFPASSSSATTTSSPSNNHAALDNINAHPQFPPSSYPSLLPTTHSFSSYLSLLATSGPAADVALVFGWMKRLGIQPDDECLGIGMAVWEGVSCGGLLVERWGAGSSLPASDSASSGPMEGRNAPREQTKNMESMHGKEYHNLTAFLSSWLGPKRVPGEKEMRKWRDVVRRMRERVRRREG